ncbi:phospholipase D-like protein [Arcticibacter pallidicorallinus]|uniref:phospholipase D n=1 Tax=Arcticibacter pallidicorallinus TaxID=1259464 RepID=A0A2T0U4G5_9SPHI|nr:phospholipase D-like domain-containing protein [Arcticibacter pallidicorallinus]PRY52728.1 phospholipase D-like protein [Arcticibacter pallidicorallinus]
MEQKIVIKAHFENIEPVVVKLISEAKISVLIVMAWLTSNVIKRALYRAKLRNSLLQVELVVDDNEINDQYFLDVANDFQAIGILIKKKIDGRFLHRKFMIIDEDLTLLGSYNYSGKAKRNAENVALIRDDRFNSIHKRVFWAITEETYVDENVQLLFDHPEFAQRLLCTYYPFTREQYKLYKDRIINGYCFTHENGLYDEIKYDPGFIFNQRCWMDRKLIAGEFKLPINKELIKNWIGSRNENLLIDGYRDDPEYWDELGEQIERNWDAVDIFFRTLFDTTWTYDVLKSMINNQVDIIIEDRLWPDNFALFLNQKLVNKLFASFPKIENDYSNHEMQLAINRLGKKLKKNKKQSPL